jgi:S1-C subfamily serine protease
MEGNPMKKMLVLVLGAMLAIAATASAQSEKCTADIQTCLNNWASVRHAAWVGLDYDRSEPNVLKVKSVTPMSPAAAAGFQPGDIITAVNGADINDKVALKKARGEWVAFQAVTYTVRRDTESRC